MVAIELWGAHLENHKIVFYSDNECTVAVINKISSKCPLMMKLVRRLVVAALRHNILFRSQHVPGKTNLVAEQLSRFMLQEARDLSPC